MDKYFVRYKISNIINNIILEVIFYVILKINNLNLRTNQRIN